MRELEEDFARGGRVGGEVSVAALVVKEFERDKRGLVEVSALAARERVVSKDVANEVGFGG